MILNRIRIAALALFAAILATFHLPAMAQDNVDPYEEMYAAIQSGVDQDVVIENALEAIRNQYAQIPDFITLEAQSPGLINDYVDAISPVLMKSMTRSNAEMKVSMIALLRSEFTPEGALEVAAHYRTDAMQRLMGNVSRNFSPDNTLSGIETDAPVTETQINRDINLAATRGALALSAADRAEITRKMAASPTLRKFEMMTPKIVAVRTEQENKPLLASEEAELEKIAEEFFVKRFGG
ncbi:hypothetical protein [Erythrobacter crassostreae]|uniref:DUF2059 domain-containing protein n=1 Tax=Erythrobacter crassostreae TaxID=2828328 RepID=A0A9X1F0H1_9SPHN|nr:hypothetical protein [Erythrobacter crassostrea]MBV7258060.1 hypothetical protein [Erythrobacter crassostrea]